MTENVFPQSRRPWPAHRESQIHVNEERFRERNAEKANNRQKRLGASIDISDDVKEYFICLVNV
jgi:hypothetical protein